MSLFKLRGDLNVKQRLALEIGGILFLLLLWHILTMGENPMVRSGILPSPGNVFKAFGELYAKDNVVPNTALSIGLNLAGYLEAVLIAIPLGFLIGLIPFFRGSLQRPIDAIRYIPLPAIIGIFIAWFNLGIPMKAHFLAFGILIYLLPVVVQRIDEVKDVYLKTVYTLGANAWQTVRTVYVPSVISRLSDDIRVLTAISWTYIIIAESIGGEGGIGSLIWRVGQRQGRIDKVFALLAIIIIIGILQDKLFVYLDRLFFPHKYQTKGHGRKVRERGVMDDVLSFARKSLTWVALLVYGLLFINEFTPILGGGLKPLSYLFGQTLIVIHILFFLALAYQARRLWKRYKRKK